MASETSISQLKADEETIVNSYSLKFDVYSQEIKSKMQNHFSNKIQSIHSKLVTIEIKKDNEIKDLRKKRVYYYLKKSIPSLIILGITFLLFYFLPKFNFSNSLSIGYQWLLGILINASTALLTAITSLKKDKHEILKSEITNKFFEGEKELILEVLDQDFESFKIDFASEQSSEINELLNQQSSEVFKMVLSDKYNLNIKILHSKLVSVENILKKLITEYSIAINEFKGTCSKVLNNTANNKEVLLKQSKLIKENSISPSFRLLEQTRDNIAEVKNKIERVDFV